MMDNRTNATVPTLADFFNSSVNGTVLRLLNSSLPLSTGSLYSYPELVLCAVGFSILIVVTLGGNSLVLVAVARTKKLQTATNVFVVNLSVSDCLSCLAFVWSVPAMVSTTPGYPLQTAVPCIVTAALVFITVSCSLNSLANIALNRCLLITRPKETYQWLYTPKKIALMVLIAWLVPFSAVVVPPLYGVGDIGFDPESRTCTDIDTHTKAAIYDKIQFGVFFPFPCIVIIVSYILIWRHIKKHFKKRRQNASGHMQSSTVVPSAQSSASMRDVDGGIPKGTRTLQGSLRRVESRHTLRRTKHDQLAITKNLFVVVFAFIVCFMPLAIMVVTKNNRYQLYGGLALFLNGCINPLIYAAKHPHLGPVLRAMIRCRCSSE
ncbi:protein trapped in endoderm-1-like [Acanthaster planci]|uniref:Protein trapped in endoderm-1-like n=1 Tax=Acanthaster planci TaxID=133434 RepID=A0A8B7YEN0_ACAPL|nr:protein trapped in endoderm-1-like [Acanthaster planci]XP_022091704.1 protein trapped in endoderm-1-like [Acanthaster planci]